MDDLEHIIEQKKADIQIGDLPTLEVVPLQMNQLFYNLISNALKFSKKDTPPKIDITSRKLRENEVGGNHLLIAQWPYVEIAIKDNGIGFDQKYNELIFMVFHRLNPPEQEGTGIGLALVKLVLPVKQPV